MTEPPTADLKLDTSNWTDRELYMFRLGERRGRDELIGELLGHLEIDHRIAKAIRTHEELKHEEG